MTLHGVRTSGRAPTSPLPHRLLGRVVGRFGWGVLAVAAASAAVFWLASVAPFDPVAAYLGSAYEWADPATRARVADRLQIDQPWWVHYGWWVAGLGNGDAGWSLVYRQPVTDVLSARVGWSVLLGGFALLAAVLVAGLIAAAAARAPGGLVDRSVRGLMTVLAGTPPFLFGLALIAVIAVAAGLLPAGGLTRPGMPPTAEDVVAHLVLPVATVALSLLPGLVLHLREAIRVAYAAAAVDGARGWGLPERQVRRRYVWPQAIPAVAVVVAARVPELVTGTILAEAVFGWPGAGQALVAAATSADYPLLAALTVLTGASVVTANLCADLAAHLLDPRMRKAAL